VALRIDRNVGTEYAVVAAIVEGHPTGTLRVGDRDIPVIAPQLGLLEALRGQSADTLIVVGQASGDSGFVRSVSWQLEETGTELVLAAGLTDVAGPRIDIRPVEGLPLMHVELPNFEGGKHLLKRAFDVVVSAAAIVATLPVWLTVAVLIALDDRGPVLFRQQRVGKDGRLFAMVKFRSMVPTAESDLAALTDRDEGAGVLFKVREDPRVTRVGRILRKYSLDELPQLWNILRGDMSIVGPRPPLSREVSRYEDHVHRRLYIKPGLTGLWQINGRSDLSWEESVRLDLYYVANWSLATDLVIMWRTVKVVLRPRGAY
jgi:exopolysaccharide biosynthesis polyprenyl glycosylphosphotransferase